MHTFDGIAAKIRLVDTDLNELDSAFRWFSKEKLYTLSVQVNPQLGIKEIVFHPTTDIPLGWSARLGTALYLLRSSLDNAIYVMAQKYAPNTIDKWTAFPISDTKGKFYGSGPKDRRAGVWKIRGLPKEAFDLIERIQPFKVQPPDVPENTTLWVFDELANIDKHRTLNLYRRRANEMLLRPKSGSLRVSFMSMAPILGKLEDGTIVARYRPSGALNDEMDVDIDIDFGLALDDGGPKIAQGRGAIGAVREIRNLVVPILRELQKIYDTVPAP